MSSDTGGEKFPYNWFKENLREQGYLFAQEIRDGKWDRIAPPDMKSSQAYPLLIPELQRRCPGFSYAEYSKALADGFAASR